MTNTIDAATMRHVIAKLIYPGMLSCVFMALVGFNFSAPIVLISGAVICLISLWKYSASILLLSTVSFRVGLMSSLTHAAYEAIIIFYPMYLIFYRGAWRLTDLFGSFSWVVLGESFMFILFGYWIASSAVASINLHKSVSNRDITII